MEGGHLRGNPFTHNIRSDGRYYSAGMDQAVGGAGGQDRGYLTDHGLLLCRRWSDCSKRPCGLHDAMNSLVKIFERVGLKTNTTKTEVMTFVPDRIRTPLTEDAY